MMVNKKKTEVPRTSEPGPGLRGRVLDPKSSVRSAGNSPATSPALSRKVLEKSKPISKIVCKDTPGSGSSIDILDESDIVVDTSILSPMDVLLNSQGKPTYSELKSCPCSYSNHKATYVVCAMCAQEWHNTCVNLEGLTQAAVKKLTVWKCPRCYTSPFSPHLQLQRDSVEMSIAELKSMIRELVFPSNSCAIASDSISNDLKFIKGKLETTSTQVVNNAQLFRTIEENNNLISAKIEKLHEDLKATPPVLSTSPNTDNLEKLMYTISEQLQTLNSHTDHVPSASRSELTEDTPMSPNTESPHLRPPVPTCEPYVRYVDNAIGSDLDERLIQFVEKSSSDFKPVGESRDTVYYGEYGYWYTGQYHEPRETPLIIQELLDTVRPHLTKQNAWINSCLVSRYKSGSDNIPYHRDDEAHIDPDSEILTVSIGAKRTVSFRDNTQSEVKNCEVAGGSVYIMSRFSQDFWQHGISPDEGEDNGVRYSFTFRHIAPHFLNSTVIIGDSNTKYLSFGCGIGSFGKWMPGKRIRASHIEHIPEPDVIGPSSNIVIHTGINNLNSDNRRSNKFLINLLEAKCNQILKVYPRSRVYISLLLPTKLRSLNNKIRDFNSMILEMTYGHKGLHVIDSSLLRDRSDCLGSDYGRFVNSMPDTADPVHLGRRGIRIFSANIKRCIMRKSGRQSAERFAAGGGDFGAAANRRHRDGYQPS